VTARLGIAADDDPFLGLIGVMAMRDTAEVLEEHHVDRARTAGWTWAEIVSVLKVSPQAVHQRHATRLRTRSLRTPMRTDRDRSSFRPG